MFTCTICDKKYKYESEKNRHEKSHVPEFECTECLKKFSFISALRRHQKQHKRTERVTCLVCGRSFRDDTLLQRHIKYAHKETHICPKCQAKFNSLQALQSHQKTHKPVSERRYKCSYNGCIKTFNFAHHLRNHELTHSGEKQHHCDLCGKGFIQLHHLKTHLRSHQPNSWLSCSISTCDKLFTNEYALKRHVLTHRINKKTDAIASKDQHVKQESSEGLAQIKQIDIDKIFQKDTTDWFHKYELIDNLSLKENTVIEKNNNVQNIPNASCNGDLDKSFNYVIKETDTNLVKKSDTNINYKGCACDKVTTCSTKDFMPELKYYSDGTIKIKEFIDEDIIIEKSLVHDAKDDNRNEFSNSLIPYNSCKAVLGKCIVSGSGTINEECLCAKMTLDDDQIISQEIDEITPHPVLSMG